mmetsp:Transcript_7645/g.8721  ORF Transcript_7645/g.8721 Transcript_7645/m.8721 type:complete len:152 (-) Transcript_7645:132-587(-)|eukprot:CAMPEP_0194131050 /NCGR_PEP_ID=MMETSP0152-20130528/1897_1 /TAXON_ID=1049557 /ORGANISM="Thalassiothrix antarctica, Strain L6-D1" /LENGTH=151 /DNA_ID=CAMNT_0038825705 /DNA_START=182 /DNA_END=637 /DNA_ORIENTATION=+
MTPLRLFYLGIVSFFFLHRDSCNAFIPTNTNLEKVLIPSTRQATQLQAAAKDVKPEVVRKAYLVNSVAEITGESKQKSEACVDAVIETIIKEISLGKNINISGFGIFKRSDRKARTGRNPKTGESLEIPAKKAPSFTAAKNFKERVNGDRE